MIGRVVKYVGTVSDIKIGPFFFNAPCTCFATLLVFVCVYVCMCVYVCVGVCVCVNVCVCACVCVCVVVERECAF